MVKMVSRNSKYKKIYSEVKGRSGSIQYKYLTVTNCYPKYLKKKNVIIFNFFQMWEIILLRFYHFDIDFF